MKNIVLKSIQITNFKGIRSQLVELGSGVNTISGKNGSGKTTIYDAFTWCLFGKDSKGRADFEIKPLDLKGKTTKKQTSEVTLTLDINGTAMTLTRALVENWITRRGSAIEEFKGNKTELQINGVPVSASEFATKINDNICDLKTLQLLTDVKYFTSLKTTEQRALLVALANKQCVKLDEASILLEAEEPELKALQSCLKDKTSEDYAKELKAQKRKVKEGLNAVPARIDECDRMLANLATGDADSIQDGINQLDAKISKLSAEKAETAAKKVATRLAAKLEEATLKRDMWRKKIGYQVQEENEVVEKKRTRLLKEIGRNEEKITEFGTEIIKLQKQLKELADRRAILINEWRIIKARKINLAEQEFCCPTCGHVYEGAELYKRREEFLQSYISKQRADLAANESEGKALKAKKEELEGAVEYDKKRITELTIEKENWAKELEALPELINLDIALSSDDEFKRLDAECVSLQKRLDACKAQKDEDKAAELKSQIENLKSMRAVLQKQLSEIEQSKAIYARRSEIEKQAREMVQAAAEIEQSEYALQLLRKKQTTRLTDAVNSLFIFVHFKMFDEQINGGEVETCEAMVDGVPYSDLNTAMQINAGLDIINTFRRNSDTAAPVFIDNAESINKPILTQTQQIRLAVTTDEELTITKD